MMLMENEGINDDGQENDDNSDGDEESLTTKELLRPKTKHLYKFIRILLNMNLPFKNIFYFDKISYNILTYTLLTNKNVDLLKILLDGNVDINMIDG